MTVIDTFRDDEPDGSPGEMNSRQESAAAVFLAYLNMVDSLRSFPPVIDVIVSPGFRDEVGRYSAIDYNTQHLAETNLRNSGKDPGEYIVAYAKFDPAVNVKKLSDMGVDAFYLPDANATVIHASDKLASALEAILHEMVSDQFRGSIQAICEDREIKMESVTEQDAGGPNLSALINGGSLKRAPIVRVPSV